MSLSTADNQIPVVGIRSTWEMDCFRGDHPQSTATEKYDKVRRCESGMHPSQKSLELNWPQRTPEGDNRSSGDPFPSGESIYPPTNTWDRSMEGPPRHDTRGVDTSVRVKDDFAPPGTVPKEHPQDGYDGHYDHGYGPWQQQNGYMYHQNQMSYQQYYDSRAGMTLSEHQYSQYQPGPQWPSYPDDGMEPWALNQSHSYQGGAGPPHPSQQYYHQSPHDGYSSYDPRYVDTTDPTPGLYPQHGHAYMYEQATSFAQNIDTSPLASRKPSQPIESTSAPVPKKGKGRQEDKDPNKPKRPLSAYNLFFRDERAKMLSEMKQEKEDKEVKDEDPDTEETTEDGDRKRKAGDSGNMPKRKSSKRAKPSGLGFKPMAQRVAARWKAIDADTLEKYNKLAKEDLERYTQEMQEYRMSSDKSPKNPAA